MSESTAEICAETRLTAFEGNPLTREAILRLEAIGVSTLEELYEFILAQPNAWFASANLTRDEAKKILAWLKTLESILGEVPQTVFESLTAFPLRTGSSGREIARALPSELSGAAGTNRATGRAAIESRNDWEAIEAWLAARAENANTNAQYKKEAERFLLWCTMERGKALSSITVEDAALFTQWLEELGRTEDALWKKHWRLAQSRWIGPKNAPRLSEHWRPYNGALSVNSRKTALTVVRLLFNFLVKTRYLQLNPFDAVSTKVRLLRGESTPREFADRSLTESQWSAVLAYLNTLPESLEKSRMRVILSLGKGLGMRAAEMIHAQTGWINARRIGNEEITVIEIVGKGDKVRRLPLSEETAQCVNRYLARRGLPKFFQCPKETYLLASRKRGSVGHAISRSGLYRTLTDFFEAAARFVEEKNAADAAKLRASSTHWLRHTFATTALKTMELNIVQNAMGHASIGTTSRYLTPEEAEVARAMKKMKAL